MKEGGVHVAGGICPCDLGHSTMDNAALDPRVRTRPGGDN
jgi:hypothetical protein